MQYESENIRVKDQDELDGELDEQLTRLKGKLVDVMNEEKVKLQVALSLFATLYTQTAHDMMGLPKEIAIEAITGVTEMNYAEDETEEVRWLN